MEHIKIY